MFKDHLSQNVTAPDFTEPIVGWRLWAVGYDKDDGLKPYLMSLWQSAPWPRGEPMVARCMQVNTTHMHWMAKWKLPKLCCVHSPTERCKCGVYAYSDPGEVTVEPSRKVSLLVGRVALWGKTIRHERGYRAQYGYPVSIGLGESASLVCSSGWDRVEYLENSYGVALDDAPPKQQRFDL